MRLIFSIALFILFHTGSFSQKVLEQKIIYSTPGVNTKLTNGYGVSTMGGIAHDNSYSNNVEVLDLKEQGFVIRNNFKVIIYDNNFNKINEADITPIIIKGGKKIQMFPGENGVWFVHEPDILKSTKEETIGYLPLMGSFKKKQIIFDGKYSMNVSYAEGDEFLVILAENFADEEWVYYKVSEKDLAVSKEVKKNIYFDLKSDKRIQAGFTFTSKEKKDFYIAIHNFNKEGKTTVVFNQVDKNGEKKHIKDVYLKVPEIANLKLTKIDSDGNMGYYADQQFAFNELTGDIYYYISFPADKALAIIVVNLYTEKSTSKFYTQKQLEEAFNLSYSEFATYGLNNILNYSDSKYFFSGEYLVLSFHGLGNNGLFLRKMMHVFIDRNASIHRITQMKFPFNATRNNEFILYPKKLEDTFKDNSYSFSEIDLIYSYSTLSNQEINPQDNLFRILKRNGFSIILNFSSDDSRVMAYKIESKKYE